jgi:hypothetical protein
MARPTFLIIGGMKCGTTSLHYYLSRHPEVQMTEMKETNFFAGPPNGLPYPPGTKRIETLERYERLFDGSYPVRGEASPSYTMYPRHSGVPERIREIVPDAKLIYLVRDPVARTLSHFHHSIAVERERRPLQDALRDLTDQNNAYTVPSFYASQLERYLRYFDLDRVHIIDQADLLRNRGDMLKSIFAFVGVNDTFNSPRFADERNTGKEQRTYSRFVVLQRRVQASPLQRLPGGLRRFMRLSIERVVSRPLEPPTLDDELRERLQALYAPDAQRLRELTGKSFPTWSV